MFNRAFKLQSTTDFQMRTFLTPLPWFHFVFCNLRSMKQKLPALERPRTQKSFWWEILQRGINLASVNVVLLFFDIYMFSFFFSRYVRLFNHVFSFFSRHFFLLYSYGCPSLSIFVTFQRFDWWIIDTFRHLLSLLKFHLFKIVHNLSSNCSILFVFLMF